MKVALDTNILAYAEGVNGGPMKATALALLEKLPHGSAVLPLQTLGELFSVLVGKADRQPASARAAILSWRDSFLVIDTSDKVMVGATDLATDHQLRIWDAVILSAAAEAGCRLLLSDDLREGFTWRGGSVTNPLATSRHMLLNALLNDTGHFEA